MSQDRSNNNWWDGRQPNSFFSAVYRCGDNSVEGHLDDRHLSLEERTKRECAMVESVLNLKTGDRLLDCPCGYGRHSIELAMHGYDVTGVDLCPQFIDEARQSASALPTSGLRFFEGDMRSLPSELGTFDACLSMFFSFGFFDDHDNLRVLKEYHKVLRPGGRLFIHTDVNPDRVAIGQYVDRSKRTLRNEGMLYIEEHIDLETRILKGNWTITSKQAEKVCSSYTIRIYSHEEMQQLLRAAGFSHMIKVFPTDVPGADGNPPQEVVYVATY